MLRQVVPFNAVHRKAGIHIDAEKLLKDWFNKIKKQNQCDTV